MTRRDPCCADVERQFEALTEGRIDDAERQRLEQHMATCPSCSDLAEIAQVLGAPASAAASAQTPDLTANVLARTAGEPCVRVRESICDFVDGVLPAADAELLSAHATRCASCGSFAAVLTSLAPTLREMASVEPDPGFKRAVVRATLGPDARWTLTRERWAQAFSRWVTRPRFGLEVAYIGAMLLVVVFGLPFSPLHDVPTRALAWTERGAQAAVGYSNAVGQVPEQVAGLGDRAWQVTGGRVSNDLSLRYARTRSARRALRANGDRLRNAATIGDVAGSRNALNELGNDLGDFVRLITDTALPTPVEPGTDLENVPDPDNALPGQGRG